MLGAAQEDGGAETDKVREEDTNPEGIGGGAMPSPPPRGGAGEEGRAGARKERNSIEPAPSSKPNARPLDVKRLSMVHSLVNPPPKFGGGRRRMGAPIGWMVRSRVLTPKVDWEEEGRGGEGGGRRELP